MRLTTALLADFAQVREGLLIVASGGITRVAKSSLPDPLGLYLALVVELQPDEIEAAHHVRIVVIAADSAKRIGTVDADLHLTRPPDLQAGETMQMPMVVSFSGLVVDEPGTYDINIDLDGEPGSMLSFTVQRMAPRPVPGP